jgi:TonB family protein
VTLSLWISNLVAYSLQIAVLAATGTLLAYIFRLRIPRVMLSYWQILLLMCLFVPYLQNWSHPVVNSTASVNATTSNLIISKTSFLALLGLERFLQWKTVFLILAAGTCLRLIWIASGLIRLRKFRRKSQLFPGDHSIIQDMQCRAGVRATVLLSDAVYGPVTFGIKAPTIILPLSYRQLSEPCKRAVLCHELLHVRRRDWVLIIIEEFVRSVFWFHPAVWWLLNRVQLCREQVVDYEVVQLIGNKQPYLDSLLEFAQMQGHLKAVPAPLFLREHHLAQRVALLIKEASMNRLRLTLSLAGISALLAFVLYLSAGWFPLAGSPAIAQNQSTETTEKALQEKLVPQSPGADPAQKNNLDAKPNESKNPEIRMGDKVSESKLIRRVAPVYPQAAKDAKVQGTVVLSIQIDEEGNVTDAKVERGYPILDDAAVEAVKQWKYSPTLLNGKPVNVTATVSIVFQLK